MPDIDRNELMALLSKVPQTPRKPRAKRKKQKLPSSFPDYGRSLVAQRRGDPTAVGALRGLQTGSIGAVLGALVARLADQDAKSTLFASLLGGLTTGIPGYMSGKQEQESVNSKLLALRRMGIETPAEFEAANKYPLLAERLTAPGERI